MAAPRDSATPLTAIEATDGGTRLRLHVQPRARRSEVAGTHGNAVRIRLSAPPVDGAANAALVEFLASRLGLPQRAILLESGHRGRRKTVILTGISPAAVSRLLFPLAPP